MDEIKIFAIMLQVAPDAVLTVWILHSKSRVVAVLVGKALRNFFVAIQAFKRRGARSELMATRALRRSC